MINGIVNAAAELERWVPGTHETNTFALYAMPLFGGLQSHPMAHREAATVPEGANAARE